MTAKSEEVVVEKKARVVEEVVVNKTVEQKTETVRDTVRRSDVEVEQTTGPIGREHYQKLYAKSGHQYEYYEPAYQYGTSLRNEVRYADYDWARLEPDARRSWEQRYPATPWEQIKDAVHNAWDKTKRAAAL